jgi:hypothetical protein
MKLARFECRWAEAAVGAIFPGSREDGFADIAAMDVPGFFRDVMRYLPLRSALGVRIAIWIVAWAPLFVIGRFATIAGLALGEREAVLDRLSLSTSYTIRSLVMILKTMGALLYAGDDGVRARMQAPVPASLLVSLRPKPIHLG